MTELTLIIYPRSKERSVRVKGAMVGWTEAQIVEHVRKDCRRYTWESTVVDVYTQTSGGWAEPWGEVDLATGDYRRRSR